MQLQNQQGKVDICEKKEGKERSKQYENINQCKVTI